MATSSAGAAAGVPSPSAAPHAKAAKYSHIWCFSSHAIMSFPFASRGEYTDNTLNEILLHSATSQQKIRHFIQHFKIGNSPARIGGVLRAPYHLIGVVGEVRAKRLMETF